MANPNVTETASAPVNVNAKVGGDDDPQDAERAGCMQEVGGQAVWSLSSCKPGTHSAPIATGAGRFSFLSFWVRFWG